MRPLTVKERILLHLFDYARFADSYEAPLEVTQEGIAKAATILVPHVNQYVRPLIVGELVETRTGHIQRQARRRKVYFLTTKGRQNVAALRTTLLPQEVPFKKATGEVTPVPLAKVYHEERRGATLLQLVQEVNFTGAVSQVVEVEVAPPADFTQEVPTVERFFGRSKELAEVLKAVETTPIIAVTGFAGIGKTTLGAKVCEGLRGKRALFWRRIRPWDSASDLVSRLAAFLKSQGRVSLHNSLSLPEARELSRVEERLVADLAALPVLLIFDDVQDASADADVFLALLARVVRTEKGPAILFLSRSVLRFISQRQVVLEGSVTELPLSGLDKKSSAALLAEAGVPTALINRFAEASGGNPLFLQLFARTPHHQGVDRGWDTVATYIAEEIEPSLDAPERDCLEAASLYDIPVPPSALLLEGRATRNTLIGLQRKGLLGQVGAGQYVLHDTLKEFFQQGLAPDRRARLAAKIVTWLLERGEEAARRGEPQEAVGFLANAAKLEPDRGKWAVITERIGEMRLFMGHYVGAEEAFRAVLAEATDPRVKARLRCQIATALHWSALQLDDAEREIDAGLALLPPEPTPERVLLLIRRSAIALTRGDLDRTEAAAREAVDVADRLPLEAGLRARARLSLARTRLYGDDPFDSAATEADDRAALEIFKKTGNDFLAGVAETDLAATMLRAGRIEEGLRELEAAGPHMRAAGMRFNWVAYLADRAYKLLEYRGDFGEAERLLQQKAKEAKQDGILWQFLETYLDFAQLLRRQGRYEEAAESLGYFLQTTAEGDMYQLSISWWLGGRLADLTLMVRLSARCGDLKTADAYFREAEDLARDRPPKASAFELAWAEAAVHAAKGEFADAEKCYRRALKHPPLFMLQRMVATDEPRAECMLDFGRFLMDRAQKDGARDMLRAGLEIFSKRSMKAFEKEALDALSVP